MSEDIAFKERKCCACGEVSRTVRNLIMVRMPSVSFVLPSALLSRTRKAPSAAGALLAPPARNVEISQHHFTILNHTRFLIHYRGRPLVRKELWLREALDCAKNATTDAERARIMVNYLAAVLEYRDKQLARKRWYRLSKFQRYPTMRFPIPQWLRPPAIRAARRAAPREEGNEMSDKSRQVAMVAAKKKRKDVRITVCMPPELAREVERAAREDDREPSSWIRKVVRDRLEADKKRAK